MSFIINPYVFGAGGATDPVTDFAFNLDAFNIALSDNTAISTFEDSSANNFDGTQTGSARPTYRSGLGPAGNPTVVFDGSDDFFELPNEFNVIFGTQTYTAFFVVKPDSVSSRNDNLLGALSSNRRILRLHNGALQSGASCISDGPTSGTVISTSSFSLLMAAYDHVAKTMAYRVNGSSAGGGSWNITVGGDFRRIGTNSCDSNFMQGQISHVRVYARILSGAEITAVETYLQARWGV